jgi:hypothetical protein
MNTPNSPLNDPRLKADIHRVPDGYFDQLPLQVQRHVATHPGLRAKPWRYVALRYVMPYATAFCLLVGSAYFLFLKPAVKPETRREAMSLVGTDLLTREEALEYLHQNVDHLDEALLTENMATLPPAAAQNGADSLPATHN